MFIHYIHYTNAYYVMPRLYVIHSARDQTHLKCRQPKVTQNASERQSYQRKRFVSCQQTRKSEEQP